MLYFLLICCIVVLLIYHRLYVKGTHSTTETLENSVTLIRSVAGSTPAMQHKQTNVNYVPTMHRNGNVWNAWLTQIVCLRLVSTREGGA